MTLGQPRNGELAKKLPAGPSANTDPLPKSLNSSVELLWLFFPLGISSAKTQKYHFEQTSNRYGRVTHQLQLERKKTSGPPVTVHFLRGAGEAEINLPPSTIKKQRTLKLSVPEFSPTETPELIFCLDYASNIQLIYPVLLRCCK